MSRLSTLLILISFTSVYYTPNAVASDPEDNTIKHDTLNMSGKLNVPDSEWIGDTSGINDGYGTYKNEFTDGVFRFDNYYMPEYNSWGGFMYTNKKDIVTADYSNNAAITGAGKINETYITANSNEMTPAVIHFAADKEHIVPGMHVTNSTYGFQVLKNGNAYAKKFGGTTGTDEDWFKLTAIGYNSEQKETGRAEFYLADFRFADAEKDYIVNQWEWFNLASLGTVSSIRFEMSSTDNGQFGMNTPSYFCLDNLITNRVTTNSIHQPEKQDTKVFYAANQIHFYGLEGYQTSIYNANGTKLHTLHIPSNQESRSINLNKGIYIVRAIKEDLAISYKLMVN